MNSQHCGHLRVSASSLANGDTDRNEAMEIKNRQLWRPRKELTIPFPIQSRIAGLSYFYLISQVVFERLCSVSVSARAATPFSGAAEQ